MKKVYFALGLILALSFFDVTASNAVDLFWWLRR